jgi:uncharacterized membrane protein YidH (DUF202 family)
LSPVPSRCYQVESAKQRTDLAWGRSGLAVGLVVAVILRRLGVDTQTRDRVVVTLVAGGLATWLAAFWGVRRLARSEVRTGAAFSGSLPRLVTLGTLLVAAAAFTLILLPGP